MYSAPRPIEKDAQVHRHETSVGEPQPRLSPIPATGPSGIEQPWPGRTGTLERPAMSSGASVGPQALPHPSSYLASVFPRGMKVDTQVAYSLLSHLLHEEEVEQGDPTIRADILSTSAKDAWGSHEHVEVSLILVASIVVVCSVTAHAGKRRRTTYISFDLLQHHLDSPFLIISPLFSSFSLLTACFGRTLCAMASSRWVSQGSGCYSGQVRCSFPCKDGCLAVVR